MLWRWSFGPAKRQYHSGRAFAQPCRCAHFQRRIPRRAAKSDGAHGAGHELEPGARSCARPGAAAEARPAADPSAGAVGLLYTQKNNSGPVFPVAVIFCPAASSSRSNRLSFPLIAFYIVVCEKCSKRLDTNNIHDTIRLLHYDEE